MKKGLRVITLLVLCMALLVPATGLAAGSIEPADPSNTTTNGTDGKEIIPVYGYIGQDTEIVDPEPENPEVPPETQIYVEVPVKVIFAAFESDAGAVTSPKYTISNLSTANAVKVEIDNFAQRSEPAVDLNGNLSLKLTDHAGAELVDGLFPSSYPPAKLLAGSLAKKTDGSSANKLGFAIGGTWSGNFKAELHPEFDMTLKFSVA